MDLPPAVCQSSWEQRVYCALMSHPSSGILKLVTACRICSPCPQICVAETGMCPVCPSLPGFLHAWSCCEGNAAFVRSPAESRQSFQIA